MSAVSPRTGARPAMYLVIFGAWFLSVVWFHPRLMALLSLADGAVQTGAVLFFIIFTELAWLYGYYNVGVVLFALRYRRRRRRVGVRMPPPLALPPPAVALLYTTSNDFVEESAASCLGQRYPDFTLYLLDDSSDPAYRARVDAFAGRHPDRVRVVRRPDRRGFKAGNINHGLAAAAVHEPVFALVDADEILPPDFLRRMLPQLLGEERCGYVQANHRSNPAGRGALKRAVGVGIDIHWKWYHPLRNRYGFVMLLGHGAVIRRRVWQEIGGFPEIVSEDLAFSLRARQHGWYGVFVEDVICLEEFPEDIRAFRVRHMKWTRGTCEFFAREMWPALKARRMPLVEKLDVLFPALSLPLALVYFLFVIDANVLFALFFTRPHPLTLALGSASIILPTRILDPGFGAVSSWDFFLVTLLTFLAPILCFIIDLGGKPKELFRFLCQSTVMYAALGPISSLGVLGYLLTGKATFLVTGDRSRAAGAPLGAGGSRLSGAWQWIRKALVGSHPDHLLVQGFEVLCGLVFGAACLQLLQVSFFGLALGFVLLPILHHVPWDHPLVQRVVYLPFLFIVAGLVIGGLGLLGMQSVFFGYGFHF
jgi:cellulose synthase/poly-beta-1,6-N-acetylglucosamine synthase-like glycosyltransferase